MRKLSRVPRIALHLALCFTIVSGGAIAQDSSVGEALYLEHCASCHGVDLEGDGPMSGVMTIKPVNLTALSSGNQGIFPIIRVVKRIDGRDPLVAHGSPMPVYGYFFEGDDSVLKAETGQPILTSRAVVDLVAYIKRVQK